MRNAIPTLVLLLAGVTLGSWGCASTGEGEEQGPYLTVYVDNMEAEPLAVYVTARGQATGRDDACSVPRRATRHRCRVGWLGTGAVVVEAALQNQRTSHSAELESVSRGNTLCLQVRGSGIQLRRC